MKKSIYIMLAIAAVLAGCDKLEKENEEPVSVLKSTDYSGTLTVNASSGAFDTDSIKVSFNATERADSASIILYKVKFSPRMPVSLDVTIPGIVVKKTEKGAILSCDSIVPLAMGGEYPNYTVKGFQGEIMDDLLTFSLNFGSTPTSYQGKAQ
ncbi:MAG: hypothetical protein J6W42_04950 [Bacteroidaceae bacterium]|jgi:hypothetical protein|nr:hypothetical protein [Bacteroidaceae bacterium]